ncbi:hypothetical protein MBLNU459_g4474t1 [Dothideomycetes sp. NU459]
MAATLQNMALRACVLNVAGIADVGDLPYDMVRPILRKIENPDQLREIEKVSPQIAGEDAEIWQMFIKRDIQGGEKKLEINRPKNPLSWWKVYRKLKREDEEQRIAAEDALKAALSKHKSIKEGNATQIVHAVIPQAYKPSWGSGPREKPSGSQALKNAKSMADKMTILKRQTAQRRQGRNITQSIPSHELQTKRSVIQRAPQSMVNQYVVRKGPIQAPQATQQHSRAPVFVSRGGTVSDRDRLINAEIRKEQEERERRLRALTGAAGPSSTSPSKTSTLQPNRTPNPAPAPAPALMQRKRPAYNPMMPAKRRKP